MSIKQKLTILIVTTSGVAVLMACVAVGAYHYRRSKDALVRETTELAVIIETNSQAALAFRDAAGGDEILSALAANAHIAAAAIYDSEGRLFGTYARGNRSTLPTLKQTSATATFRSDDLVIMRPIVLGDETLGSVQIVSDLLELQESARQFVWFGSSRASGDDLSPTAATPSSSAC